MKKVENDFENADYLIEKLQKNQLIICMVEKAIKLIKKKEAV